MKYISTFRLIGKERTRYDPPEREILRNGLSRFTLLNSWQNDVTIEIRADCSVNRLCVRWIRICQRQIRQMRQRLEV